MSAADDEFFEEAVTCAPGSPRVASILRVASAGVGDGGGGQATVDALTAALLLAGSAGIDEDQFAELMKTCAPVVEEFFVAAVAAQARRSDPEPSSEG